VFSEEPYCGPPPILEGLWSRWTFDPLAALIMIGIVALWLLAGRRDSTGRRALLCVLCLFIVAFFSPLCALTVALFSARVFHHVVLISIAAPLIAIALPWRTGPVFPLAAATMLHVLIVWIWHAPLAYDWAVVGALPYWLMQLSLLSTGWVFWRELFLSHGRSGASLIALIAFVAQMGLLGALLVFAPFAIYPIHFETTTAFGISALADQQLAGLVMWVPAMLPYIAAALILLMRLLKDQPEAEAGWSR
jgi:putative membrane protein